MSELFGPVLAAGAARVEVDDHAWVRGMLEFESALAAAQADAGLLAREHADAIAAACEPGLYDPGELGRAATGVGNPVAPLVRALTDQVGGDAARYVHTGATSQDVLDTAAMLVARRAVTALLADLDAAADTAATLAAEHAGTVQVGRTLLQHAVPVTFGLAAAGWLAAIDAAAGRLRALRFPVQLGGAAGTLASLGDHGPAVLSALSARLGLTEPVLPWHTDRTPVAALAGALGAAAGAVSGLARSVVLLAQSDVAEVREEGPSGSGGSSTMPQKQNPVAAVAALASARQAPGLVATLLGAMEQEHQRAAGAWHAEWRPLAELLRATGSAAHWLRTSLGRLHVDADRMRDNLDRSGGVLLAERVTTELAPAAGRLAAHDAVTACARRAAADEAPLADLLAGDPVVGEHLTRERIEELLDPAAYLGSARVFVERALAAHRERKESGCE